MLIANPIYDTVFKYMMSDNRIAKLLLSAIIGEKIAELSFGSREYVYKPNIDRSQIDHILEQLTVCYFDFNAKIETADGKYKTIIIELQKAKLPTDIMRFRRYLGLMYQDIDNSYDKDRQKARQIYCIYFLNYDIGISKSPVLKVDHTVSDLTTGEIFEKKSEFIESLNHKSWIVQVKKLNNKHRNELENLLSIFDQDKITNDKHILNIDENQYPDNYRPIIRKLLEACASEEVRNSMHAEDDVISVLIKRDQLIASIQKELTEKDKELTDKDKELTEKDKELTEKDKELTEKDKELTEKDKEIAKKDELIAQLLADRESKS